MKRWNKHVFNVYKPRRVYKLIYLKRLEDERLLPSGLLQAVFIAETYYRSCFFRLLENSFLIVNLFLNFTLGAPIRNITVGYFQVGVIQILNFYGRQIYAHSKHIKEITIDDALNILKSLDFKHNAKVASYIIDKNMDSLAYTKMSDDERIIHAAHLYNGNVIYGINILKLIKAMNKP